MATLLTEDFLRREARLGLRADFERMSYSSLVLVLLSRARARNPESGGPYSRIWPGFRLTGSGAYRRDALQLRQGQGSTETQSR
jgi:hypothetical protein